METILEKPKNVNIKIVSKQLIHISWDPSKGIKKPFHYTIDIADHFEFTNVFRRLVFEENFVLNNRSFGEYPNELHVRIRVENKDGVSDWAYEKERLKKSSVSLGFRILQLHSNDEQFSEDILTTVEQSNKDSIELSWKTLEEDLTKAISPLITLINNQHHALIKVTVFRIQQLRSEELFNQKPLFDIVSRKKKLNNS